jgi:hypothetical protein
MQGVKSERKRYRDQATGTVYGPASLLLWGYDRQANEPETTYLGRALAQFAEANTQYMLAGEQKAA